MPRRVLYSLLLGSILIVFALRYLSAPPMRGRWSELGRSEEEDIARDKSFRVLQTLGYQAATAFDSTERKTVGVTVWNPAKARAGPTLYTSGHDPEALLIDMSGDLVQRWNAPEWSYGDATFPQTNTSTRNSIRRAIMTIDGGLLALYDYLGMLKLSSDSAVEWVTKFCLHHDMALLPDGKILAISARCIKTGKPAPDDCIVEDGVALLDQEGKLERNVWMFDAIRRSRFSWLVREQAADWDPTHLNSLQVLTPEQLALLGVKSDFAVILSSRTLSALLIVDLNMGKVVWVHRGGYREQHEAKMYHNRLLLFDNLGYLGGARALEIDPSTGRELWQYPSKGQAALFSPTIGTVQLLSNRNVLITESDNGRVLEVTPQGEVAWEFLTPHRVRSGGSEYVATVFAALRVEQDTPKN